MRPLTSGIVQSVNFWAYQLLLNIESGTGQSGQVRTGHQGQDWIDRTGQSEHEKGQTRKQIRYRTTGERTAGDRTAGTGQLGTGQLGQNSQDRKRWRHTVQ